MIKEIIEKPSTISFEEITDLLHIAHSTNYKNNLIYATATQSVEVIKNKIIGGTCFVALNNEGKVVGTVTSMPKTIDYWYYKGEISHLRLLAVDPECRKQGIAENLLKRYEDNAKSSGYKIIVSDSAEENEGVKRLYLKNGFKIVDFCKYDANNFVSAVYAKWLYQECPWSEEEISKKLNYKKSQLLK